MRTIDADYILPLIPNEEIVSKSIIANAPTVIAENAITELTGDLISREALKKEIASLVVNGESRIYEVMPRCGGEWIDGIASAYREIDNAPTVIAENAITELTGDLISREALKKEFARYGEKAKFTQGACQRIIDNAPTVEQPTGEWIPVSERLPKDDDEYIVTFLWNGEEEVGKSWYNTRFGFACDVIAWMSKPEPYKKGGEEE